MVPASGTYRRLSTEALRFLTAELYQFDMMAG